MKYDFDRIIDRRGTGSVKWDLIKSGLTENEILPMWVADMDFICPKPVTSAIENRAKHPIYGYPTALDSCYESIIEKVERDYSWKVEKEWIVYCDGVVGGLYSSVNAFTDKGGDVIIQEPVYFPFRSAVEGNKCFVKNNGLVFDGERYVMDYEDLNMYFNDDRITKGSHAKIMILCNPHNPVGRVWNREELIKLGRICLDNNCIIIADEIHCDLTLYKNKHTTFASISEEFANQSITFIAPSKAFNVAGLCEAVAIIPNKDIRDKFIAERMGASSGNVFGKVALEAAYRYGDEYLKQLKEYLEGNINFFMEYVEKKIPRLKVMKPEATYLLWVDMRELGISSTEINEFLLNEAKLKFNDGAMFGYGGEGFQRINIGCPRIYIEEALRRLEGALIKRNLL
jgi:cystathionine beta-lyase